MPRRNPLLFGRNESSLRRTGMQFPDFGVHRAMSLKTSRPVMLSPGDLFLRRVVDLAIASVLLILLCVPSLILCACILIGSPGWPIYRQKRVGRDGRLFRICKFRTMYVNSDRKGPSVTATDDCRVTPVGRWLRDHKLDELPQLLNVWMGDMSLVGPRPQVPRFVEHFDSSLRTVVLAVRPGITGPTSLHFRHEESLLADKADREGFYISQILPTKLAMDAHYVRTRSFGNDMRVLGDTARLFSLALMHKMLRIRGEQPQEDPVGVRVTM